MFAVLGKRSALRRRMKEIDKELTLVDGDLQVLSRRINNPDRYTVELPKLKSMPAEPKSGPQHKSADISDGSRPLSPVGPQGGKMRRKRPDDDKLAEYLSGSFNSPASLSSERNLQRNKAIFMIIVFVVLLIWVKSRFF